MKKQVMAIAAAVAILFGAGTASATGSGYNKNYNDNYNKNYNKNYNDNYNQNKNYNDNYNKNENKNYNDNYNKNTNNNNSINNNNSTANAESNSSSNANANATGGNANANATGGEGGDGGEGGNSNVNVEGDDAAASSAAPIALTTSNDTCMGSTGLGVQGMQFGFSIGSTWTDSNCIMLKNSRELKMQGHDKAAKARLCMDSDNAMAFELAGEPCPRALQSTQNAIATLNGWKADYAAAPTVAQTATLPVAAKAPAAPVIVGEDFFTDE